MSKLIAILLALLTPIVAYGYRDEGGMCSKPEFVPNSSRPWAANNTFFITTWYGCVYSFTYDAAENRLRPQWDEPYGTAAEKTNGQVSYDDLNEAIYFGATDRRIHKLDAETGIAKWRCHTGTAGKEKAGKCISKPLIVNDRVYVACSGKLFAFDRVFDPDEAYASGGPDGSPCPGGHEGETPPLIWWTGFDGNGIMRFNPEYIGCDPPDTCERDNVFLMGIEDNKSDYGLFKVEDLAQWDTNPETDPEPTCNQECAMTGFDEFDEQGSPFQHCCGWAYASIYGDEKFQQGATIVGDNIYTASNDHIMKTTISEFGAQGAAGSELAYQDKNKGGYKCKNQDTCTLPHPIPTTDGNAYHCPLFEQQECHLVVEDKKHGADGTTKAVQADWRVRLIDVYRMLVSVNHDESTVYATSRKTDMLHAIDGDDGTHRWSWEADKNFASGPVLDQDPNGRHFIYQGEAGPNINSRLGKFIDQGDWFGIDWLTTTIKHQRSVPGVSEDGKYVFNCGDTGPLYVFQNTDEKLYEGDDQEILDKVKGDVLLELPLSLDQADCGIDPPLPTATPPSATPTPASAATPTPTPTSAPTPVPSPAETPTPRPPPAPTHNPSCPTPIPS